MILNMFRKSSLRILDILFVCILPISYIHVSIGSIKITHTYYIPWFIQKNRVKNLYLPLLLSGSVFRRVQRDRVMLINEVHFSLGTNTGLKFNALLAISTQIQSQHQKQVEENRQEDHLWQESAREMIFYLMF